MSLMRRWAFLTATLALAVLPLSCAWPPQSQEEKPEVPPDPGISLDLLVTPASGETSSVEARFSVSLAEMKGAKFFFQELASAGPMKGVRFVFRTSTIQSPGPSREPPIASTPDEELAPSPPVGGANSKPPGAVNAASGPTDSRKKPEPPTIAGQYVSANPVALTASALQADNLPTVSCGPGIPGKEMISLVRLVDGAARRSLSLFHEEGTREITLVSDESAYGRRGRSVIRRIAEELGIRVRQARYPSGEENDPAELFQKGGGSRPLLAWLDRDSVEDLLRAARRSGHTGPILLGPAAVHPDLASPPPRRWTPKQIAPPRNQPGENILAIAHKMAVAEHLGPNDPLRINLVRFRDAYFLSYEKRPLLISACTYDALLLLMDLIVRFADPKSLSTLGARVLSEMRNRNRFSGILGAYQIAGRPNALYREAALGEDSFILVRAQNGRWMPAKGPGKRLRDFKDLTFSPTRSLPPRLQNRATPSRHKATVPLVIRR